MDKLDKPCVLTGIKVLDLCRRYPGAYTCMFLGDFGAEVIKVDPPGLALPVSSMDPKSEEFVAHFAPDRNKKSIVLDLKSDKGREVFYELVKEADVVVEGFRPGIMKELKADYETLRSINPRLIYCSLTGFGQDGPYRSYPGHDMNYIAIAGALSLIGPRDGAPCLPGNLLGDMAGGGLHAVIGILMAIIAREKTGCGQFVDISYTDGVISLLAYAASLYFATGIVPRRGETSSTGGSPWAQVFRCKDGEYLTIGCAEPHFWENLCRALECDDLIPFQNPPREKRDKIVAKLADTFLTRERDEWFRFLSERNTCVGPVYYLAETFSDPQIIHRQMVVEINHPRLGRIRQIGIPIKLSDTPGQVRSLGVRLGMHTEEVLRDLGYSTQQIAELKKGKVVE